MEYKAYALMAILLSSVAAVSTLGTAYAQAGFTVATDNKDYTTGDEITVSGNIGQAPVAGQPLGVIQVFNPNGAAYRFDQVPIAADGSYTYTFKVGGPLGVDGEYNVKFSYNGVTRETSFNFAGGEAGEWETATLTITAEDGTTSEHEIQYKIEGGELNELTGDQATKTITAMITANSDGQLTIQLPRDIADAKEGDDDAQFAVFVNDEDVTDDVEDDGGDDVRTLTIPFFEDTEQIDITGTFLVPEFGAIAAIVLAVAIVGIIVATTRYSKFSFLPKM